MNKNYMELGLIVSTVLLLGCSEISPEHEETNITNKTIEGTWSIKCGLSTTGFYYDEITIFNNDLIISSVTYFNTSSCSEKYSIFHTKGTYNIGDVVTLADGTKANKFDITPMQARLTILNSALAAQLSNSNYCGVDIWEIGIEIVTTGSSCASKNIYSLIKINGDTYQEGDAATGDTKSDLNRPKAIKNEFHIKQK